MKNWKDTMLTGILTGIITPMISFRLYVFLFRKFETTSEVFDRFVYRDVITHVISLSAIPNLLVFFLFLWAGKERSAYGVIGATLIYALLVAGLIFLG
jgi:hypothetical protein